MYVCNHCKSMSANCDLAENHKGIWESLLLLWGKYDEFNPLHCFFVWNILRWLLHCTYDIKPQCTILSVSPPFFASQTFCLSSFSHWWRKLGQAQNYEPSNAKCGLPFTKYDFWFPISFNYLWCTKYTWPWHCFSFFGP